MKNSIFFLFCFCWMANSQAQSEDTYPKWHVKPALGVHIPLTNLLNGDFTDNLLDYEDQTIYGQLIAGSYFFSEDWGVDLAIQMAVLPSGRNNADRFINKMHQLYDDQYFVTPTTGASYASGAIGSGLTRASFSVVRRLEFSRWMVLPQIGVGVTSFYANWGNAILKEKDSNTILEATYNPSDRPNDFITFSSALTLGFRINKNFIANVDVRYGYFKSSLIIEEQIRNVYSDEITARIFDYNKQVHTLSVGIGFIYEFDQIFKSNY